MKRSLQSWLWRDPLDKEVDEEFGLHLELLTRDFIARGIEPDTARERALGQLGDVKRLKQACIDISRERDRKLRITEPLGTLVNDIRYALRRLRGSPGFSLIAVLTLALGIGANTSAFSIINALLLRPLPYPQSEDLDRIFRATPQDSRGSVSPADYLDLTAEMRGYGEIAAYGGWNVSLAEPGRPAEMVSGLRVSANLFPVLGIEPQPGRGFRPDESIAGNHRVLVISHRYWQNRFGGEAGIIGRTVRVDGEPHEIVGVLPDNSNDFRHLGPYDLFRPIGLSDDEARDRQVAWIRLVGRRSSTLPRGQAERFIADFGNRLTAGHPAVHAGTTWRTRRLIDTVIPDNAPGVLAMLIGLSGFVLLIACSNLANLLLARTMARAREFAVRAALGASRVRLLRPLVVESLLLAFAGCVGAIYVATWSNHWLNSFTDRGGSEPLVFALDWRVLSWGVAACLCTALAFCLAPAFFALRLDVNNTLKSQSRGTTGDRGHRRFRHLLVVGQFVFATVLLAGASVFARGLYDLNTREYGWESDRLITGRIVLPSAKYPDTTALTNFHRLALDGLEALPGVASASISSSMPFVRIGEPRKYVVEGRAVPPAGQEPVAVINRVSPGYFDTVGTRVLRGRSFNDSDTLSAPRVLIVNQAMARGLFGEENPLGRRIAEAGGKAFEFVEIVGVAGDVQSVIAETTAVSYQLYLPIAQEPKLFNEIAVRTAGIAPLTLTDSIRTTIAALDPDLPVQQLQDAGTTVARANRYAEIIGKLLSFLAVLGLGLASLGLFGVISRSVTQRASEFGIRLALGAGADDIMRLVLTSGSRLALIGCAIGLVGAAGISRLIAAGWPAMQTSSVPVLIGVTLLLSVIALVACYIPARYASRINPNVALRAE